MRPNDEQASYYAAITANPDNERKAAPGGRHKRSVGIWSRFWGNGQVLNITFTNELPPGLKDRIERLIRQWEPSTNLTFTFDDNEPGHIRITTHGQYNESFIGTDALLVPLDQPTLSLGTVPEHPHFDAAVFHEFGHALGLEHEHQHPKADIPWDKPEVYAFYKANYLWTEEEIDKNLLNKLPIDDVLHGPYDRDSIMHYKIANELTLGDWEVGDNLRISKLDRRNMRRAYPKAMPTVES